MHALMLSPHAPHALLCDIYLGYPGGRALEVPRSEGGD